MTKKSRDFYHIQDQLPLAWRYSINRTRSSDSQLEQISQQIDELAKKLVRSNPELGVFIDLSARKMALLEQAAGVTGSDKQLAPNILDAEKQIIEVSLSSSGMGFFSQSLAEDDAKVDISLTLDTIESIVNFKATVLECRLSADSENPGYWIRVRFARDQERQIDQLLAHVTQRQIQRLERHTGSSTASNEKTA